MKLEQALACYGLRPYGVKRQQLAGITWKDYMIQLGTSDPAHYRRLRDAHGAYIDYLVTSSSPFSVSA